jgi:hypothetical protein
VPISPIPMIVIEIIRGHPILDWRLWSVYPFSNLYYAILLCFGLNERQKQKLGHNQNQHE